MIQIYRILIKSVIAFDFDIDKKTIKMIDNRLEFDMQ